MPPKKEMPKDKDKEEDKAKGKGKAKGDKAKDKAKGDKAKGDKAKGDKAKGKSKGGTGPLMDGARSAAIQAQEQERTQYSLLTSAAARMEALAGITGVP